MKLPSARMSSDSVTLELTFVRIPTGETELNQKLWQELDEQWLLPEQRQHLNANGFRCGLAGSRLTPTLSQLIKKKSESSSVEDVIEGDLDVLSQNRRIQVRQGKRSEIVTKATQEELIVLHKDPEGRGVTGQSLRQAQCVLATRCYHSSDGSVRIDLTPEIHHGVPHRQWVAGEGTFRQTVGRQREAYRDLIVTPALTLGQTLVVSCSYDPKGLGRTFFVDKTRGDAQQKLLLIRLAQTQHDGLFDPMDEPLPADRSEQYKQSEQPEQPERLSDADSLEAT